ncbi:MAG: hypothetical protein ACRELB_19430 [Polyangiaceae bacterium]
MRAPSRTCGALVLLLAGANACGAGGGHGSGSGDDAGGTGSSSGSALDGSGSSSSGGGSDGGGSSGGPPITCPGPGSPMHGGACGTERWDIKTGTDPQAGGVSLVPRPTTIAALRALPASGGGNARETPTETTLFELKDVTLTQWISESDSDYHLVLSDGAVTMIAEIPAPSCTQGSVWACFTSHARSVFEAENPSQYPGLTVTVRGVGFFDFLHGQTGVAPNGIELHPVLQICFGQGCTPS